MKKRESIVPSKDPQGSLSFSRTSTFLSMNLSSRKHGKQRKHTLLDRTEKSRAARCSCRVSGRNGKHRRRSCWPTLGLPLCLAPSYTVGKARGLEKGPRAVHSPLFSFYIQGPSYLLYRLCLSLYLLSTLLFLSHTHTNTYTHIYFTCGYEGQG